MLGKRKRNGGGEEKRRKGRRKERERGRKTRICLTKKLV